MNKYNEERKKTFNKIKLVIICLVSLFSAFLFAFGLFMIIYQYDTNTVVFGIILVVISLVVLISDVFILKFWKSDNYVKLKYDEETSNKISEIEKEIEEIKRKNNL